MAKLDKKYLPFIKQAKEDYVAYCNSMPEGMRGLKKPESRIRYFDALQEYYLGESMGELSYKYNVTVHALRNSLAETQNKVRLFLQSS